MTYTNPLIRPIIHPTYKVFLEIHRLKKLQPYLSLHLFKTWLTEHLPQLSNIYKLPLSEFPNMSDIDAKTDELIDTIINPDSTGRPDTRTRYGFPAFQPLSLRLFHDFFHYLYRARRDRFQTNTLQHYSEEELVEEMEILAIEHNALKFLAQIHPPDSYIQYAINRIASFLVMRILLDDPERLVSIYLEGNPPYLMIDGKPTPTQGTAFEFIFDKLIPDALGLKYPSTHSKHDFLHHLFSTLLTAAARRGNFHILQKYGVARLHLTFRNIESEYPHHTQDIMLQESLFKHFSDAAFFWTKIIHDDLHAFNHILHHLSPSEYPHLVSLSPTSIQPDFPYTYTDLVKDAKQFIKGDFGKPDFLFLSSTPPPPHHTPRSFRRPDFTYHFCLAFLKLKAGHDTIPDDHALKADFETMTIHFIPFDHIVKILQSHIPIDYNAMLAHGNLTLKIPYILHHEFFQNLKLAFKEDPHLFQGARSIFRQKSLQAGQLIGISSKRFPSPVSYLPLGKHPITWRGKQLQHILNHFYAYVLKHAQTIPHTQPKLQSIQPLSDITYQLAQRLLQRLSPEDATHIPSHVLAQAFLEIYSEPLGEYTAMQHTIIDTTPHTLFDRKTKTFNPQFFHTLLRASVQFLAQKATHFATLAKQYKDYLHTMMVHPLPLLSKDDRTRMTQATHAFIHSLPDIMTRIAQHFKTVQTMIPTIVHTTSQDPPPYDRYIDVPRFINQVILNAIQKIKS